MSSMTQVVNIEGMTCGGCANSVNNAVTQIEGVQAVEVDLAGNKAAVTFDSAATSVTSILEAIEDAGFDASVADS